jgi:hypothetical protein
VTVVRIIIGIVAGFAFGLGVVIGGDVLNHTLFPPPAPEQWAAYALTAPVQNLVLLPIAYILAALVAAFVAAKIAGRAWAGWIAGGFLTGATFVNLFMITHPIWMIAICVIGAPLAIWFGARGGAGARVAAA